jgi:flagellar M-ring protein FliF
VNQAIEQIRDLFASMTPAARLVSALLAGVIVVSIAFLFQGYSSGPDDLLFNGEFLPPRDADRVEAAIAKAGLGQYRREGNRFFVPRGNKSAYLAAVADAGALPADFDTLLEDTLDLSPFVSSEERKQRMKAIRERKLSMIVRTMTGVEDARVMYDIQEPRGFGKGVITATVSLQPASDGSLGAQQIKMIQKAVAGAIAGLDPANVTILNLGDGSQYGGTGGYGQVAAEEFDQPYFQARTRYEQLMKGNIERLLRYIPGVQVEVSAELDEALTVTRESIKNEGEGIPLSESSQVENLTEERSEDAGRPGLQAQGPSRRGADEVVAKSTNTESIENRDAENFIPTIRVVQSDSGLIPKHVRAAVAIPSDYLVRVWREKNPDAPEDQAPQNTDLDNIEKTLADQIQEIVTPLLPKELGENPYPNVKVTVFQSLTPDAIEPPSMSDNLTAWAGQHLNTVMMSLIALISLVMLRSLVKAAPPADPAPALRGPTLAFDTAGSQAAAGSGTGAAATAAAGDATEQRQRLRLKKGPNLRDDLTEMVREDPDAAAAILRSWIGHTA